ncbi:MAG: substrate-binding domain-containing protein [Lachnospiraceae bacterium]|jgi:ABC-type sugar transport system substrate-binding protein|nr:substrate-binding domain-containing protein [Lachnospiraceae bacterium]
MKKKLLVAALISSMVASMSFTAFADETEAADDVEMVEATADVNGDGKIIVGYVSKNLTDPFHGPINEYAQTTLDQMVEDGVIDEWTGILDGNTDAPTQIDRSSDCIAKGCDFVIILPCEAEASDPAVTSMAEAGINVIVVNSKTTSTDDVALTYCGSDDVYAGELLGQWVLDNCPDGGKYLHCNGILGNSAQIQRTEGMHNILDSHEEFEMVGDEDTQWKGDLAATAAENYIGKYGDELVAIICDNDDMSSAAQTACNSMGRSDIICVGVDGNQHPLEMIRDGELKGTVLQDGVGQMTAGIDTIVQVIEEGQAPKNVTVPFVMIDESNVGDYLAE